MRQIEIQYFFPLTEQIDLDLDFTPSEEYNIEKRKQYWNSVYSVSSYDSELTITPCYIPSTSQDLVFHLNRISFSLDKKPNLFRKILYKMLGFNVK